ncbi:hypothetical protein [Paenibacillus hexagrammi]|uniref:Uncharacterized protein n=1 Tax=Paenibacillus hexagrammi TaxID=2908839 RepID=A0ABY3SQ28_9BACL|nr:hypothetical protein [Paenibacillus sp. YPD9-1]UJF36089.1 hypothetical protein L0M14_14040 [Paenibacillus sp. YPD9-1]
MESLLTILSLAEVHQQRPESMAYLKQHVKEGTLYGKYSAEGVPLTDIRSTAIYAITAMIGSVTGDQELYESSIEQMNKFQINDTNSELEGGSATPAASRPIHSIM